MLILRFIRTGGQDGWNVQNVTKTPPPSAGTNHVPPLLVWWTNDGLLAWRSRARKNACWARCVWEDTLIVRNRA
jgi:hypothetical protein